MSLPFGFTAPQLLVLLVPAVLLTLLLSRAARHHVGIGRRRLAIAIRVILLGLIVFALAGLQWVWPVDKLTRSRRRPLDSVGTAGRAHPSSSFEAIEPGGDQAASPLAAAPSSA
jgi:hypothetical protein